MSAIFGGPIAQAQQPTQASGVNIQTSAYGQCIPLVVGTTMIAPEIIWNGNFQSHGSSGGGSGGKGGGGGGGSTSYTYSDGVALALCEGPINGIGTVWQAATAYTASQLGFTVFDGTYPQTGWSALSGWTQFQEFYTIPTTPPFTIQVDYSQTPFTDHGVTSGTGLAFTKVSGNWTVANSNNSTVAGANEYKANSSGLYTFNAANAGEQITITYSSANTPIANQGLPYNGLAYIANYNLNLGSSSSLPNHQVEVYGFLTNPSAGQLDANPADWINLLLPNTIWGLGNLFPSGLIGSLSSYSAWCAATGLLISAAYTKQTTAAQILSDLATYTNADVVWTTSLTLIPRGDQSITANGVTYAPPSLTFSLTDDDWLPASNASTLSGSQVADPLVGSRADPSDQINQVSLEYLDRTIGYAPNTAVAQDMAAIQEWGLNQDQSRQAHIFALSSAARLSAQLLLQRSRQPNTWTGTVGEHQICIDIGDWGTIQSTMSGVPALTVRVTEVTEQSDGALTYCFEEIQTGAGTAVVKTAMAAKPTGRNYAAAAPNTDTPVIFEAPLLLCGEVGSMEIWIYANGPSNWAGCQVYLSSDNQTYAYQGEITVGARIGTLTAALPSGFDPDTTDTLALLLVENGQILSGSKTDADSFNTALWVDGEIISYATANLTGANAYSLSYLRRGGYDTANGTHAIEARVVRMDGSVMKIAYTASQIGQTLYLKLLSFNPFGGGLQSLDNVQPFTYTITGQEAPPDITGLSISYVANLAKLTWNIAPDPRQIDYEVRFGATWSSAQVLGNPTLPSINLIGNGTYWVCARFRVPGGPTVYSAHPQSVTASGVVLTQNIVASTDQASEGWKGTFSNTTLMSVTGIMTNGLTLQGTSILSDADVTQLSDIFTNNAVAGSGTYQVPASDLVSLTTAAACNIIMTVGTVYAVNVNAVNIATAADVTAITDVLSLDAGGNATVTPQINCYVGGVWQGWQNYTPGSYYGQKFNFRLLLATSNPQYTIYVSDFAITVDVPNRVDKYVVTTSGGAGSVTFQLNGVNAPFNGSVVGIGSPPHLVWAIVGEQPADILTITTLTTSQVVFTITNGGVAVNRTVNILAQGY